MGPLDKFILHEKSLSATENGFSLAFRSHWYRSLPVSSIGVLKVSINGVDVPSQDAVVEVNGKEFSAAQLGEQFQEWWFILDDARLKVTHPGAVKKGVSYKVMIDLGLYIPYILVGPNAEPVLSASQLTKELVCQ